MRFYSDIEMMKERFAKLLLGEDMSGGGKGVSSALALSNAITNLAGTFCFLYNICSQKKCYIMTTGNGFFWKKPDFFFFLNYVYLKFKHCPKKMYNIYTSCMGFFSIA